MDPTVRRALDATLLTLVLALPGPSVAQAALAEDDATLARTLGGDERGMHRYVLVILKSGPTPVPDGPARDRMFKGHFENIERLANEGTLVLAGPLDGVDGWRGLFVLAVPDVEGARRLVATDPVVAAGEMVPEFHRFYGSAALKVVNDVHRRLAAVRR
jgi:uncharacterized protein YciI